MRAVPEKRLRSIAVTTFCAFVTLCEKAACVLDFNLFYSKSFDGKWIFMREIIKEIARIDKELEKREKSR